MKAIAQFSLHDLSVSRHVLTALTGLTLSNSSLMMIMSHNFFLNIVWDPREDAASNVKPPPETLTIGLHGWWLKLYRSGFMLTRESVREKQLNPLTLFRLSVYDAAF